MARWYSDTNRVGTTHPSVYNSFAVIESVSYFPDIFCGRKTTSIVSIISFISNVDGFLSTQKSFSTVEQFESRRIRRINWTPFRTSFYRQFFSRSIDFYDQNKAISFRFLETRLRAILTWHGHHKSIPGFRNCSWDETKPGVGVNQWLVSFFGQRPKRDDVL